jgi:hypothetical protein
MRFPFAKGTKLPLEYLEQRVMLLLEANIYDERRDRHSKSVIH